MSMFGESVRWRRKMLGITQRELAGRIRVRHHRTDQSFISRIEAGRVDPCLSTVTSIARALQVKPWQLVAGLVDDPFWDDYLALSPIGKREVQRMIDWQLDRRG